MVPRSTTDPRTGCKRTASSSRPPASAIVEPPESSEESGRTTGPRARVTRRPFYKIVAIAPEARRRPRSRPLERREPRATARAGKTTPLACMNAQDRSGQSMAIAPPPPGSNQASQSQRATARPEDVARSGLRVRREEVGRSHRKRQAPPTPSTTVRRRPLEEMFHCRNRLFFKDGYVRFRPQRLPAPSSSHDRTFLRYKPCDLN